jgi:cystathionine beta-lyase/cystathionine gamma-synthase
VVIAPLRRAVRPPTPPLALVEPSLHELADDLDEVAWLARDLSTRVVERGRALVRARRHLHGDSLDEIEAHARVLVASGDAIRRGARALRADTRARRPTVELLDGLTRERLALADRVRTLAGIAAATIVAAEWQSPSFGHSVRPNAGTRTDLVRAHVDDYRRDRHTEAAAFERAYLDAFARGTEGLRALATSCGMSAFVTIVTMLRDAGRLERVVLGASTYHECRDLLRAAVPASSLAVADEASLPDVIRRVRPTAVVLDALANAPGVAMADLAAVARAVSSAGVDACLVVDTTGLPSMVPMPVPRDVRVIAFESLTKYAQYGLDRVTAGMILARGADADALDAAREHLGANIPDASVHAIATPDRRRLGRRLARIGRNAETLASRIAASSGGAIAGVDHPSLPDHPAYRLALGRAFRGGWLALRFAPVRDRPETHERFVSLLLEEARARQVPLVAGASFGLDVTRVYHTGATARDATPFVRISPGIEHALDVERLGQVLDAAASRLGADAAGSGSQTSSATSATTSNPSPRGRISPTTVPIRSFNQR